MRPPISVVIFDDHEAVRIGVRTVIDAVSDMAVARSAPPDVAVVDIALPDRDGIEPCRDLRSTDDGPVCVTLSSYAGAQARLAAAVAGAAALVSKAAAVDDLVGVLRRVASGASLLDRDGARRLLREQAAADPRASVSPQERRVLGLIAEGLTNRQIGATVHLTEKTVNNYVSRLLGDSPHRPGESFAPRPHDPDPETGS